MHGNRSAFLEIRIGTGRELSPETKLGFFVGQNRCGTAGSLTSTYRVVNTTLRAESEKTAPIFLIGVGEFQLSKI
jgi:hypothetical protein